MEQYFGSGVPDPEDEGDASNEELEAIEAANDGHTEELTSSEQDVAHDLGTFNTTSNEEAAEEAASNIAAAAADIEPSADDTSTTTDIW